MITTLTIFIQSKEIWYLVPKSKAASNSEADPGHIWKSAPDTPESNPRSSPLKTIRLFEGSMSYLLQVYSI